MRFIGSLTVIIGFLTFPLFGANLQTEQQADEKLGETFLKAEAEALLTDSAVRTIVDFIQKNTIVDRLRNEAEWRDLSDPVSQKKIVTPLMEKLSATGVFKITKAEFLFFSGTVAEPSIVFGMKNVAIDTESNGMAIALETDYAPKKNHTLKYVIYSDGTDVKIERRYYIHLADAKPVEGDEPPAVTKPLRTVLYPLPKKNTDVLPDSPAS